MSTEISLLRSFKIATLRRTTEGVELEIQRTDNYPMLVEMSYEAFVSAVAEELKGTFIPDSELPTVRDSKAADAGSSKTLYLYDNDTYDSVMAEARAIIALAKHRKTHPPVDEAQVKAMTDVLYAATSDPDDIDVPDVARRLVESGKVTVVS